jgi:hypothetical protein
MKISELLSERSKSRAQWNLMHNPRKLNAKKIPLWVGDEFVRADTGHDRNALPVRVPKKPKKKSVRLYSKR